ncbi:MAG TPA: chromosomal replication initiator protein DnaA [Planktothrix sp.]|jgi:chromosomal replication initiator protein
MAVMEQDDVRLLKPADEIWEEALRLLEKRLKGPTFHSWIKTLALKDIVGGEALLACSNSAGSAHIMKVAPELEDALFAASGVKLAVKLVHDPETAKKAGYQPTIGSIVVLPEQQVEQEVREYAIPPATPPRSQSPLPNSTFDPKYTFATFVVGSSNRFSHSAAMAVAKSPGQSYNPLFIYGGVGLGKTHIMHAMAQEILKHSPHTSIQYVTCEKFTNEVISSIRQDRMAEFRKRYRRVGVLLIDDIQFLQGKESTQEEFFFTFNALREAGNQIVISSDRPPKAIGVEERLRSRFEWGLIADIQPPDLETRVAILQKKCDLDNIIVSQDILEYIASAFNNNIRELEGALIRATAYAKLTGEPLTIGTVSGILLPGGKPGGARNSLTFELILDAVCAHFRVEPGEVKSSKRSKDLTLPRHIVMYLAHQLIDMSFPRIGQALGNRAHTSAMYGHERIEEDLKAVPYVADAVKQIKRELGL